MNLSIFHRSSRTRCSVAAVALSLALGASVAHADGNETLGTPSIPIASGTDFVSEGVSVQGGPANVEFNVPAGATIKQVLLYWGEVRSGAVGQNANRLRVFNTVVQGVQIGDTFHSNNFRADVTQQGFVVPGNNVIPLASLQTDGGIQGAAFLVIYDAGSVAGGVGYGGSAFAAKSKVGRQSVSVVEAGPLPPAGGLVEPDPVNGTTLPGIGSATTVSARTIGTGGQTRSTSSVEDLGISVAGTGISAKAINTEATATCTTSGAQVGGDSSFANLRVGLLSLPVTFPPNTVLLNLGSLLKIVANEQSSSGSGNARSITVTGLHVTSRLPLLGGGTDVQVASATASISCESAVAGADIRVRDGADFAYRYFEGPLAFTNLQTFNIDAANADRTYSPTFFITDGDVDRPDVTEFYVDNVLKSTVYDVINESAGANTDVDHLGPLTIPAGATSIGFRPTSMNSPGTDGEHPDSLNWVFAAFKVGGGAQPSRLYSGRATVVSASVAGLSKVAVADTGELPATGGDLSDSVADAAVPSLLASITGAASSVGAGDETDSEASVEDLDVTVLGINVSADVVQSDASATCSGNSASTSGSSLIANLAINGTPISLGNGPQEISLPLGGTLYIDEQVTSGGGNSGSIEVNALRLYVPNPVFDETALANVVISGSRAGITCN